jgi:hypothetical protein
MSFELGFDERLGENVGGVVVRVDVLELDVTERNPFTNEHVGYVEVLGPSVRRRVLRDSDDGGVVLEDGCRTLRSLTEVGGELAKRENLLGRLARCDDLGLGSKVATRDCCLLLQLTTPPATRMA